MAACAAAPQADSAADAAGLPAPAEAERNVREMTGGHGAMVGSDVRDGFLAGLDALHEVAHVVSGLLATVHLLDGPLGQRIFLVLVKGRVTVQVATPTLTGSERGGPTIEDSRIVHGKLQALYLRSPFKRFVAYSLSHSA